MKSLLLVVVMLVSACSCGGVHVKKDGTILVENANDSCDLFYEAEMQIEICGELADRDEWLEKITQITYVYNEALLNLGLPPIAPYLPGMQIRVLDYVKGGRYAGLYLSDHHMIYVWIEDKTKDPLDSALIHELHHRYEDRVPWITEDDVYAALQTNQHFVLWQVHAYVDQYARWVLEQGRQGGPPKKPF